MQRLSEKSADTVDLAQGDDPTTLEPTVTAPGESAHAVSRAPSSSQSTPPSTIQVPLEKVQKLEAKVDTFLLHIQP